MTTETANVTKTSVRLPAEWEPQDAILLSWPKAEAGWGEHYADAVPAYARLAATILKYQPVILCVDSDDLHDRVRKEITKIDAALDQSRLTMVTLPGNDSWARDFGPIGVESQGKTMLLDFQFNGWGSKYPANLDNTITQRLVDKDILIEANEQKCYLEGGSVDSNGQGTMLTTTSCLLTPTRNPHMDLEDYENYFQDVFGVHTVLWIEHSWLAGDDTDGHIDMLARFCSPDTMTYVHCDDTSDEHYEGLAAMRQQLESLQQPNGSPYKLVPLPFPDACYNSDGERIPASYANFLILNDAVLVPVYGVPQDQMALDIIAKQFPHRVIEPVPARWFIHQGGSVHCLTMQLPAGSLKR